MKPWPLKPAATQRPLSTGCDQRLVVGGDVVEALHDERVGDVLEDGQVPAHAFLHVSPPCRRILVGVGAGGEVAREDAAAPQVLRREVALGRDDQRLEQPVGDRVAQQEVPRLLLDREVDPDRGEKRRRVVPGRDDHGVGLDRICVDALERPARRPLDEAGDGRALDRDPVPATRFGERLDDRLRLVEVAVLSAERGARHVRDVDSRQKPGEVVGVEELRWDAELVLQRHIRGERVSPLGGVGEEDIPAGLEHGLGARLEACRHVAVEADRLAREEAVDAGAPLLADTARLDARRLCADARPLVDDHLGTALREVQSDRQARDAGADDRDPHCTLSR